MTVHFHNGDAAPSVAGRALPAVDAGRSTHRDRVMLALASAVLLVGAFYADVATGTEVASSLFYVLAIMFGSWFAGGGTGLVLAVASVFGWWLAYRWTAVPFSHPSVLYWNLLAELAIYVITAVAVAQTKAGLERLRASARLVEAAHDALERETHAVGELQREMLPQSPPAIPGYDWQTTYLTSTRAGGDYYDFLRLPDGRVAIVVADASGHGAPAEADSVRHLIARLPKRPPTPAGTYSKPDATELP